jgi:hypothetical protein
MRRRRRRNDSARRLALLAIAGGLAAAVGAAGARLGRPANGPVGRRLRRFRRKGGAGETYRCACGARYRVSGVDRHRVYWREGAAEDAPVLGDRCVECDAALPAGHDVAAV